MKNSSIIKRLSIIAFVMVVLAAWVAPGYSVDVSWDAQYRVRAIFSDNSQTFNDDATADRDSFIDQRFRLGIKLTEAPVSGYVQLQLGDEAGVNGSHTWGTGAATNTSVIFRQAYLDFPVGPVGLRAGRTYASHGFLAGGMFENIADRYIVSYKVSDELWGNFIHAKARESSLSTAANDNDRNIYNLGFTWKPKAMPYDAGARIYYVRDGGLAVPASGTGTVTGNLDAFWLTGQGNIKAGPANIYLSAAFLTGTSEPAAAGVPDLDLSGYAAHIDVNVAPGPFKAGIVAGIGSGDDNTTDDKLETFFAPGGASYIQSHIFFQNGENTYAPSILSTASLNTQNGSLTTLSNITWAGLYGDFKATPDLTLGARIATFMQTEELTGQDDSIGNELDLTLNYMIHKNLSLLAFAAWFMPDDGITGTAPTATDDTVAEYYARLQWEFN
ncbi:MAG TPA: hypothetical protein VI584_03965 [Nitrospiria bacterium]|nr:hypothetical protein [Nitrospiria bacterium]